MYTHPMPLTSTLSPAIVRPIIQLRRQVKWLRARIAWYIIGRENSHSENIQCETLHALSSDVNEPTAHALLYVKAIGFADKRLELKHLSEKVAGLK